MSVQEARPASVEALLAAKEIVVCCGPGGVGKTTVAASLAAMAAWQLGGRVLVVTVDPARRLADALGLESLGNAVSQVPPEAFASAGVSPRGELWAAMLDTKQSWDDLVRRHAPDRRSAERILSNPLYDNVSRRFVESHDYIAAERLYELHRHGDFDLIVVDTPPSRHALDFLDAPRRMAEFFSSRLLRWLLAPQRARLAGFASRPFAQVADRLLGSVLLEDLAEFFMSFQGLYAGFVARANEVERLLADRRSTFVAVTTLEAVPRQEAMNLLAGIRARGLSLGALVCNKVLPGYLRQPQAAGLGQRLEAASERIAVDLARELQPPASVQMVTRVLTEVAQSFVGYQVVALREAEQRAELAGSAPEVLCTVERFEDELSDMAGLLRVGSALWR